MNETLFAEWLRINGLSASEKDNDENGPVFAWVDIETTGLNPAVDVILEIGFIVTDKNGDLCGPPTAFFVDDASEKRRDALSSMSDFVERMHEGSGLLEQKDYDAFIVQESGTPEEVGTLLGDYLSSFEQPKALYCAGSTVGFDRFAFIQRYMPDLHEYMHHRSVDNSTLKVLCEQHNPRLLGGLPIAVKAHRSIPDLVDSIHEYKFYLDNFIWR